MYFNKKNLTFSDEIICFNNEKQNIKQLKYIEMLLKAFNNNYIQNRNRV